MIMSHRNDGGGLDHGCTTVVGLEAVSPTSPATADRGVRSRGVHMDEAESQLDSEGEADSAVDGVEAEDEQVGVEVALGGAGEEGDGVE
ncbi:hypothetical protein NL676_004022 [Syzygium grande]|nr:hypothetical protein NL676_004022 [Syzygium grande]